MIKYQRFVFLIVFIYQTNVWSYNNSKGEIGFNSISPLELLQEKGEVFKNKLDTIKSLFKREEYSSALKLCLDLQKDIKGKNEFELEYLTNLIIADIFKSTGNNIKSLEHYKLSLLLLLDNKKFTIEKALNYDNSFRKEAYLANNYLQLGGAYLKLNSKDSAEFYFNKVLEINSLDNNLNSLKAASLTNLSGIYLEDSLFDKAKINALRAVQIWEDKKNKVSQAAALSNLANILLNEEKIEEAKQTYSKALNLIENDTTTLAVQYKESLYYNLAWTLFLLKDYMAYDYQEKSYLIKDNLRDQEMRRIVEDVYANYQVELVKNQVALKKAEERKTNYYLGALMLLILIVFGVIIYNYKLRQKNLKLNFEQNKLAQQSQIERLKSETQIRILNATLDGKESERKQIAETLHDSVSTLLSSASLHLQASKSKFNGTTPLEIEKSQTIISEASQKIRDLSHTLVSSVLLKFGLKYSINEMGQKYSNSQIEIETSTKNINRYHQSFEIKVNNIIQEFVNNILKHSKATYALVQVEEKNKQLFIHIEDNGCGFDKDGVVKKDGLGINQIEARIQMMKGTLEIDSIKNKGTKIRICLPIVEKEETILL